MSQYFFIKKKILALQLHSEKCETESKTYDILQLQMWSLLPGFCDNATDIPTAFPVIARTLGSAIQERQDLRMIAMHAIRNVLINSVTNDQNR